MFELIELSVHPWGPREKVQPQVLHANLLPIPCEGAEIGAVF